MQVQDLPAADDEFAQLASEFDTIDEFKGDLRGRLTNMARLEQASQARDQVLEELIGKIEIDVPEGVLSAEVANRHEQIDNQLAQAGLTLDEYLEESDEETSDAESFWADIDKRAGDALKAQMVLDKIADDRQIGVDQNDLTQHVIRRAQAEGQSPDQVAQHMVEHNHTAEWMTEIRRGKALAMIVEGAAVKDSDGETVDLVNLQPDGSLADPSTAVEDVVEGEPVEGEVIEDAELEAVTEEVQAKG